MPAIIYHIYQEGKRIDSVYRWTEAREWRKKEGITIMEERI